MSRQNDFYLLEYQTYNDYLDKFVTKSSKLFLRYPEMCRSYIRNGGRVPQLLTEEEFDMRRETAQEELNEQKKHVPYENLMTKYDPVIAQMLARVKMNLEKVIATIIFVKCMSKGHEISGYIDFEESLRQQSMNQPNCHNWTKIFAGRQKLIPGPFDLSYIEWKNLRVYHNNSENFILIHHTNYGLMFKHRGDRKVICVDTSVEKYRDNAIRSMAFSKTYGYMIFYDHILRIKI